MNQYMKFHPAPRASCSELSQRLSRFISRNTVCKQSDVFPAKHLESDEKEWENNWL